MKIKPLQIIAHIILILGVLLMVVPIWISFASSSHDSVTILTEGMKFHIGDQLARNYNEVLNEKGGHLSHLKLRYNFLQVDPLYEISYLR